MNFNFDKIAQEKLTNTSELLTVVPVITKAKNQRTRALLLKVENSIETILYNEYPEVSSTKNNFTGIILMTKLNGDFIRAYRIKDNAYVVDLVPSKENKSSKNTLSKDIYANDPIPLEDKVIVYNNYKNPFPYVPINELGKELPITDILWYSQGGGPEVAEEEEESDPCQKIKEQLQNTVISEKIEALKGKLTQKNETGFAQKKDGTFVDLKSTTDPNQLNLPPGSDFIGSLHTHQNPYPSEKFREDGTPITIRPIPIFSPTDVVQFLEFLKNTKKNNAPIEDVYSIMVSNSAVYQLRFTGNIDDVRTNFDISTLNKEFIKSKKDNNGDEKLGFLNFLALSIGIDGLKLFEINTDGTINNMSYDNQKNLIKTPCN